ncbi:MAG: thioredoxin-disulfide reductase [Candidatus Omnitrophica bacterium]|nr:thioredoxin-disulfide reductase [Candidatus Omnitrophota bacterium]
MYDTVIIGAGIAGDTAALYAARRNMDFLVVAEKIGGQFSESGKITNYPGIVETEGNEFKEAFDRQMEANDIEPRGEETVRGIKRSGKGFHIVTGKSEYEARSVILATGSAPGRLNVPGEEEFAKKGVTYCSVCDGPLFSGKEVVIAGGGNSAMEAADFMKDIAEKIIIVNNSETLNGHGALIENVRSLEKVEILNSAEIKEIKGGGSVESVVVEHEGGQKEIRAEGVIVEIGRSPNTGFLEGFVDLDEKGHIKIDCAGRTSVEGVFAAGDCASGKEFQYVIAAGQGCMALLKASRYLAGQKSD